MYIIFVYLFTTFYLMLSQLIHSFSYANTLDILHVRDVVFYYTFHKTFIYCSCVYGALFNKLELTKDTDCLLISFQYQILSDWTTYLIFSTTYGERLFVRNVSPTSFDFMQSKQIRNYLTLGGHRFYTFGKFWESHWQKIII